MISDQTMDISVPVSTTQTRVVLGRDILARASEYLKIYSNARLLVVSDAHVASLYAILLCDELKRHEYTTTLLTIPAGEATKSLETLSNLYAACQSLEVERGDVVVAVGGGMVGDVAGMLAGTYLRGLELVQIPTTLIAMATASIGGKAGVNFRGYKNLIGLFKQPALVLADLDVLETLPVPEFYSGLGELVTIGVLGAPEIFTSLEANGLMELDTLIAEAIQCKYAIVKADPFDRLGIRARLNLGHTFAHAIEKLSYYKLPHGIAVAIGLHIAARLSMQLDLCSNELPERICHTLQKLNLPVSLSGFEPKAVISAMRGDKKRSNGQLQFVLPVSLGKVTLISENQIPVSLLEDVLHTWVWERNKA